MGSAQAEDIVKLVMRIVNRISSVSLSSDIKSAALYGLGKTLKQEDVVKKLIEVLATGIVLVPIAFMDAGSAVERKGPSTGVAAQRPTKIAPLTEGECTQLGGAVITAPPGVCNSGFYCRTTDQKQQSHRVCLSKQ